MAVSKYLYATSHPKLRASYVADQIADAVGLDDLDDVSVILSAIFNMETVKDLYSVIQSYPGTWAVLTPNCGSFYVTTNGFDDPERGISISFGLNGKFGYLETFVTVSDSKDDDPLIWYWGNNLVEQSKISPLEDSRSESFLFKNGFSLDDVLHDFADYVAALQEMVQIAGEASLSPDDSTFVNSLGFRANNVDAGTYPTVYSVLSSLYSCGVQGGIQGFLTGMQEWYAMWNGATVQEEDEQESLPQVGEWQFSMGVGGVIKGVVTSVSAILSSVVSAFAPIVGSLISAGLSIFTTSFRAAKSEATEGKLVSASDPYFGGALEFKIPNYSEWSDEQRRSIASAADASIIVETPWASLHLQRSSDKLYPWLVRAFLKPTTDVMAVPRSYKIEVGIGGDTLNIASVSVTGTIDPGFTGQYEWIPLNDDQMVASVAMCLRGLMEWNMLVEDRMATSVYVPNGDASAAMRLLQHDYVQGPESGPTWDTLFSVFEGIQSDTPGNWGLVFFGPRTMLQLFGVAGNYAANSWKDIRVRLNPQIYGNFGVRFNGPSMSEFAFNMSVAIGAVAAVATTAAVIGAKAAVRNWRIRRQAANYKAYNAALNGYMNGSITPDQFTKAARRYNRSVRWFGSLTNAATVSPVSVGMGQNVDLTPVLDKLNLILSEKADKADLTPVIEKLDLVISLLR